MKKLLLLLCYSIIFGGELKTLNTNGMPIDDIRTPFPWSGVPPITSNATLTTSNKYKLDFSCVIQAKAASTAVKKKKPDSVDLTQVHLGAKLDIDEIRTLLPWEKR